MYFILLLHILKILMFNWRLCLGLFDHRFLSENPETMRVTLLLICRIILLHVFIKLCKEIIFFNINNYFIFLEFISKLLHKYLIIFLILIHIDIINEVKFFMMLNSGHCIMQWWCKVGPPRIQGYLCGGSRQNLFGSWI